MQFVSNLKKLFILLLLVEKLMVETEILPPGQGQYIYTTILNMSYGVPSACNASSAEIHKSLLPPSWSVVFQNSGNQKASLEFFLSCF